MSEGGRVLQFNISYHPTPYPMAMRADLEEIAEVCDGIYMPFSESDLQYMSNKLKYCVDIAHELNLLVIADFWGYGNLFACGAIPSLYTVQHPECDCVSNRGRRVPKTCPNQPGFREFMREEVRAFLDRYGADGVFWDEPGWGLPRYVGSLQEGEWLCRCEVCQAAFHEQFASEMPVELSPEVIAFRNSTMLSFLSDLCGYVKACGDHLITSTCVMPSDTVDFREAVAATENLDVFGIDPYWGPDDEMSQKEFIDRHAGEAVRIARDRGKLVESWASAWKQRARHEADAYRAAKLNAVHDLDYLSAWSYRDYISWEQCDTPNQADQELVWQNLKQAYHELREGDSEIRM